MKQYVVDAFTDKVFRGNPAAICPVSEFPSDELMHSIAKENRLSETAFTVKDGDIYRLRWFTPGGEIDLCGHATLATSYALFRFYEQNAERIVYETKRGRLTVTRKGEFLEMDFPSFPLKEIPVTEQMADALGFKPESAWLGRDLLLVYDDEKIVRKIKPDFDKICGLDGLVLHVTARGKDFDCVSRSFSPKLDVPEDPVCGSGHCHIAPYWAKVLKKDEITGYQASERGGLVRCNVKGDRTFLSGKAALYSAGEIYPE